MSNALLQASWLDQRLSLSVEVGTHHAIGKKAHPVLVEVAPLSNERCYLCHLEGGKREIEYIGIHGNMGRIRRAGDDGSAHLYCQRRTIWAGVLP